MANVHAGAVIPGNELTLKVLQEIVDKMGDIKRKIAIGVDNETANILSESSVYFSSGTSDSTLPYEVIEGKAFTYSAHKTANPYGSVGVIAYKMSVGNTLGVLFCVPYDYNKYCNWWDAKIYEGEREANDAMYKDLYYGSPYKGDDNWHGKTILGGIQMSGIMGSSGAPTLLIRIIRPN